MALHIEHMHKSIKKCSLIAFVVWNYLLEAFIINHDSQKFWEWNLAKEKLKGFSPQKNAILSFGKCLNY